VVMTLDPLHDDTWTQEYRAHRAHELDNLGAEVLRRTGGSGPGQASASAARRS
jgi:hypothetical protein